MGSERQTGGAKDVGIVIENENGDVAGHDVKVSPQFSTAQGYLAIFQLSDCGHYASVQSEKSQ